MIYTNYQDHNGNNVTEEANDIDHAFQLAQDLLAAQAVEEVYILTDQFKFRITSADNKTLIAGKNHDA